jgi:iron complex outermembrane receptor protein
MTFLRIRPALAAYIGLISVTAACAEASATDQARVSVTASRFGQSVQEVPGAISVVTGEEIRALGATDLRTALAMVAGVSVAPGGDAGPASAVPSLLGIREVDDLLLLIDGIPAGGAFRPQVEAISLNNVERIEVLRGTAPVYFGTTAFAGTINVIHYAAGRAESIIGLRYGSHGSSAVSGSAVISSGPFRQSISGEVSNDKYANPRTQAQRTQGSYRVGADVGGGSLRADLDLLSLRQKPMSPQPVDETTGQFHTLLPIDFNQLPADAKINTGRSQLTLGYDLPLSFGRWGNTLSYTDTTTQRTLGYIDMEDTPQPWTGATNASVEAFQQKLHQRDLFVDSNVTMKPRPGLDITAGVNLLLGRANAFSRRYALELLLDGLSQTPASNSVDPKGTVDFSDRREFWGVYAQTRYQLASSVSLLAGVRWNKTHESREMTRVNSLGVATRSEVVQDINRLSGSLGAQWKVAENLNGSLNGLTLHASLGNTFQPAQLDLSPNPETPSDGGGLLKPETQRSLVFGLKADALGGMAGLDISTFVADFNNQPIQATSAAGMAVLRAGGAQRYQGLDIEGVLRPAAGWTVRAEVMFSEAKYRNFTTDVDGTPTQLNGKTQILTPKTRIGLGAVYAPERGWRGSLVANQVGKHFLDRINTAEGATYTLVDASVGYRFERFTVQLSGANLGNRRDAVQISELGENQFYRMSARRYDLAIRFPFQ